jgi:hypothetical protein
MELSGLPDLALNTQIDKIAHYWTWQGSPGYVIQAGDPQGCWSRPAWHDPEPR